MGKPEIYTRENSNFANVPYKRLEINVSEYDPLASIDEIDRIIEEHFPGIPRDEVCFGFHTRTEGQVIGAKNYLMLVLQASV